MLFHPNNVINCAVYYYCRYRMAVIRALPNLEKLDDKFVTADEINVALSRGKILIHPLNMDASPPQSDPASPEVILHIILFLSIACFKKYEYTKIRIF